ncbi:MAG: SPOR domain-containing protein [Bacteroidota bacterium]
MIKNIQLLIFLSFCFLGIAQEGKVTISKDPRIEGLIGQRSAIIPPASAPQMQGYRIQVIFDSEKKVVDDARNKIVSSNQKIDTYITFNAPHFVLKIGDFRTKQEAEVARQQIMAAFPTSFVIKELINLPRID